MPIKVLCSQVSIWTVTPSHKMHTNISDLIQKLQVRAKSLPALNAGKSPVVLQHFRAQKQEHDSPKFWLVARSDSLCAVLCFHFSHEVLRITIPDVGHLPPGDRSCNLCTLSALSCVACVHTTTHQDVRLLFHLSRSAILGPLKWCLQCSWY